MLGGLKKLRPADVDKAMWTKLGVTDQRDSEGSN